MIGGVQGAVEFLLLAGKMDSAFDLAVVRVCNVACMHAPRRCVRLGLPSQVITSLA